METVESMACARARWAACLLVVVLGLLLPGLRRATADDEPRLVRVPDVRRLDTDRARRMLETVGLRLGEVYEIARERVFERWSVRMPVGGVVFQKPEAEFGWPSGATVDVIVSAAADGRLPPVLPPPAPGSPEALREAAPPPRPPPIAPEPEPAPAPAEPVAPPAAPAGPLPPPATVREEPPAPVVPDDPPTTAPAAPPAAPGPPGGLASGSPDAPRPAPPADPGTVPTLTGLELPEAEQLVRDASMELYVERVPGHPVGRVLEQVPPPRSPRPAGGVIKVVVTAGGDFAAQVPTAPEVYVPEMEVPDLLDRTPLQAGRILEALGLLMEQEVARRGLAGLVVDQKPAAGQRVPRGGVVRLWIGPPGAETPEPAEPGAAAGAPSPGAPPPDSDAPPALGPLPGGAPAPLAPAAGTVLPKEEVVPVGFTWRGVKAAQAYVVEVEEEGGPGTWLPTMRRPARKTAVLIEIERLGTTPGGRLRWRVRAVVSGREGPASDWVVLR